MCNGLGIGTTDEFIANEFSTLDLKDKRLHVRASNIFSTLQRKLGSTIRRLFTDPKDARQAYDFF